MSIIKRIKGSTIDLNYLAYFNDYAENLSIINGILKPYTYSLSLRSDAKIKVCYEITVFNTIQDKEDYENQKIINNG